MSVVLLNVALLGGRVHGGETGKRGAHADPEPHVSPLGAHLIPCVSGPDLSPGRGEDLACWDLESRPMQLPGQGAEMDARG